jgi:hypothetical protein
LYIKNKNNNDGEHALSGMRNEKKWLGRFFSPTLSQLFILRSCKARISLNKKQERQQGEQRQLWSAKANQEPTETKHKHSRGKKNTQPQEGK